MQIHCGTDIIEIERIKSEIEKHGQAFISRIYTENEIKYCESKKAMKYQHYAVRFAAKEAIFKAISTQIKDKYNIKWTNFEILDDENGRPQVKITDIELKNIKHIEISLSHCKEYANAVAIAELE